MAEELKKLNSVLFSIEQRKSALEAAALAPDEGKLKAAFSSIPGYQHKIDIFFHWQRYRDQVKEILNSDTYKKYGDFKSDAYKSLDEKKPEEKKIIEFINKANDLKNDVKNDKGEITKAGFESHIKLRDAWLKSPAGIDSALRLLAGEVVETINAVSDDGWWKDSSKDRLERLWRSQLELENISNSGGAFNKIQKEVLSKITAVMKARLGEPIPGAEEKRPGNDHAMKLATNPNVPRITIDDMQAVSGDGILLDIAANIQSVSQNIKNNGGNGYVTKLNELQSRIDIVVRDKGYEGLVSLRQHESIKNLSDKLKGLQEKPPKYVSPLYLDSFNAFIAGDSQIKSLAANIITLAGSVTANAKWEDAPDRATLAALEAAQQELEVNSAFTDQQLYALQLTGAALKKLKASASPDNKDPIAKSPLENDLITPVTLALRGPSNGGRAIPNEAMGGIIANRIPNLADGVFELSEAVTQNGNAWDSEHIAVLGILQGRLASIASHKPLATLAQQKAISLLETYMNRLKAWSAPGKADPLKKEDLQALKDALEGKGSAPPADPAKAAAEAAKIAANAKINTLNDDAYKLNEVIQKELAGKTTDPDRDAVWKAKETEITALEARLTAINKDTAKYTAEQNQMLAGIGTDLGKLKAKTLLTDADKKVADEKKAKLPKPVTTPPPPTTTPTATTTTTTDPVAKAQADLHAAEAARQAALVKAEQAKIDANRAEIERAALAMQPSYSMTEMFGRGARGFSDLLKKGVSAAKIDGNDPVTNTVNSAIGYGMDFLSSSTNFVGRAFNRAKSTKTGQAWLGVGGGVVGGFVAAWAARSFLIENTFLKNIPFAGTIVSLLAFAAGFLGARKLVHGYLQGDGTHVDTSVVDRDADVAPARLNAQGGGTPSSQDQDSDVDAAGGAPRNNAGAPRNAPVRQIPVHQQSAQGGGNANDNVGCQAQGHGDDSTPCTISIAGDVNERARQNELIRTQASRNEFCSQSNVNGAHACDSIFPLRPDNGYMPADVRAQEYPPATVEMGGHEMNGDSRTNVVSIDQGRGWRKLSAPSNLAPTGTEGLHNDR